jgi:hypothetical protein
MAQAGLELKILLPQSPKCWDYTYDPPYLIWILNFLKNFHFSTGPTNHVSLPDHSPLFLS